MSVREFAAHLGVSDRMVSKWEAAGETMRPRPVNQSALDTSLRLVTPEVGYRFATLTNALASTAPAPAQAHDVGNLVRHPLDGKLMVRVEGGPLAGRQGRPKVWVPAFYVDLNPVTVGEYARFRPDADGVGPVGFDGDEPVLGASWVDAQGYARWAGKTIITHEQWDRAVEAGISLSLGRWEWCASRAGALQRGRRRSGPGAFRTAIMSAELHQLLAI